MGHKSQLAVHLRLDDQGILSYLNAEGHAGNEIAGSNIPCAAVSVLLRTAWEVSASMDSVKLAGKAEKPGFLTIEIVEYPDSRRDMLKGITEFLLVGLRGVKKDYPDRLEIMIEEDGGYNGT